MMVEAMEKWARGLDAIVEVSGRIAAWTGFGLVVVMASNVLLRYFFHTGSVAMQELEWHLMAPLTLLCIAYTIKHDGHVQVDIFYGYLPRVAKNLIDLFSALSILVISLIIVKISIPYVMQSYLMGETSPDPGGLPYRFVLKALIPAGFVLLALQSLAWVLRTLQPFFGGPDRAASSTVSINALD